MAPYLNGHSETAESQESSEMGGPATLEDKSMPIAIVGIGFRGPGDAISVDNLFSMISEGREGRSQIPKERWNNEAFYHPNPARNGTVSPSQSISTPDFDGE